MNKQTITEQEFAKLHGSEAVELLKTVRNPTNANQLIGRILRLLGLPMEIKGIMQAKRYLAGRHQKPQQKFPDQEDLMVGEVMNAIAQGDYEPCFTIESLAYTFLHAFNFPECNFNYAPGSNLICGVKIHEAAPVAISVNKKTYPNVKSISCDWDFGVMIIDFVDEDGFHQTIPKILDMIFAFGVTRPEAPPVAKNIN
jgi:hypothetical protein